ncbi:MAG: glucose-methanol-choline oxidoreductase, partial [bacterium]
GGAAEEARRIMESAGVGGPFVRGMLNAGHFGGTVPLSKQDVATMHPSALPEGLWVADLSLAPKSQGMPTMLVAAALALRVARAISEK